MMLRGRGAASLLDPSFQALQRTTAGRG